ncbi:hypothetical protein Trydic_g4296 [Trypoxylus dichotomus]
MTIAFWNALSTKKTQLEEFVQRHQLDAAILVKSTIEHHADLALDFANIEATLGQAAPEDEEPRMRHTVSWPAFADHLSAHIGPITAIGGPIELEAAVSQITERVSDSVGYATNTSLAVDDRAFIPREVRDLIREKNGLRTQWQRTLNSASKAEYNRMARRTKVALDEFRNNRWGDFMVRASETLSEFWRAVNALKGQRVPVPPIHGARGVAFTTEDKAEAFAETLEQQCSPVYENVDVDRIGRIHRQVRDLLTAEEDDEEPIRPTSPEEVKAIVKSFRPTKAPGPDGVTYRALKHAPKKFVMHMTNICNAMLRLRHFPSQWQLADVTMIPKPGQSHNWPQNYRPISLHQSFGHEQDRRPDNTRQTAGGNGRPRRYPRLLIRFPQRAQHHSASAAPRRTYKRGLQPTGMHRDGIPRRRQSLRQDLAPGPTTRSFLSPQEDLPSQAGRTAVYHEEGHSRRAARISDLTPGVQHLHQRHPDNRARLPGDVRGRCLHLLQVSQRQSDRPTSPDST